MIKNSKQQAYIRIGKVGATYGIHGWLKIYADTAVDSDILKYKPWYLSSDTTAEWQSITLENGRIQGKNIIVKLKDFDTPEEARKLTGKIIAITRSQLPTLKANEYYWSDLVGLTVVNKNGDSLGKVIYLIETGANDVLVVKGDKEQAIPYLPGRIVLDINLEEQKIIVDWDFLE